MQRLRASPRLHERSRSGLAFAPALLIVGSLACTDRPSSEHPDDVQAKLTLTAQTGTFTALENGLYVLTLGGVSTTTGYSAEDPVAATGEASTRDVLKNFAWDDTNPPSAAVVLGGDPPVSPDHDAMLLRLMLPTYDESRGTLSMYVQADTTYAGELLSPYAAGADSSLPASFGPTTVIVESFWHHECSRGYISCYEHFGCCTQPWVTRPLGRHKVDRCWSWSRFSCQPCSDDPCASKYPRQCGDGNCYTSCADDCEGPPY